MKINIKKEDILKYVTRKSNYDAIEKIIDPAKYEVFDCGIYNFENCEMVAQSEEYEKYCIWVSGLRRNAKDMTAWEINRLCDEIAEIAPKEIKLS